MVGIFLWHGETKAEKLHRERMNGTKRGNLEGKKVNGNRYIRSYFVKLLQAILNSILMKLENVFTEWLVVGGLHPPSGKN